ncbi:hypothetical protein JCM4814A_87090 [Streptomyces phaeofaciens JCM 4814]|uniref:Uncharacterized protein n=1 Tax=Streptomyces phaeofaciens TaxID=68254 RepID=A0A918H8V0_9ACTN|nr:hypothetical protein [Streptomyces phaeofaciens]GGT45369.1 hypothetical protein GCM10010226_22670 [Streptomyces phaeofaciens]
MSELRAAGRAGPGLSEVLPQLAVLVVAGCGAVVGLAFVARAHGGLACALLVVASAVVVAVARRRNRLPARRRGGHYTPEELAELDMPALVVAVGRMLRRDGWRVLPPPRHDTFHLFARDGRGRLLDVAFRPVAEPLPDEEAACSCRRPRVRARAGPPLRLVVHRGTFTHRDEVWAAREGHTFLIDGPRLRLWARGTSLAQLVTGAAAAPPRT